LVKVVVRVFFNDEHSLPARALEGLEDAVPLKFGGEGSDFFTVSGNESSRPQLLWEKLKIHLVVGLM
jgi:hypothetical protein